MFGAGYDSSHCPPLLILGGGRWVFALEVGAYLPQDSKMSPLLVHLASEKLNLWPGWHLLLSIPVLQRSTCCCLYSHMQEVPQPSPVEPWAAPSTNTEVQQLFNLLRHLDIWLFNSCPEAHSKGRKKLSSQRPVTMKGQERHAQEDCRGPDRSRWLHDQVSRKREDRGAQSRG